MIRWKAITDVEMKKKTKKLNTECKTNFSFRLALKSYEWFYKNNNGCICDIIRVTVSLVKKA